MKRNWFLDLQTVGVLGTLIRGWPQIGPIVNKTHWLTAEPGLADQLPPVSIIVPARNEERGVERCIRSLALQDYPDFEVIVVDDGSTDRTPDILAGLAERYARIKVVRLDEKLPEGWAGKVHAMWRGTQMARSDTQWFLFSDADTVHSPQALSCAVAKALQEKADLFSLITRFELGSFWERVMMPMAALGIVMQFPIDKVNSPSSKVALANGQYLLIKRSTYEALGGWQALKGSLVDDRDLAYRIKQNGYKLYFIDGRELVSVRMYTNLAEIWSGWRKNAFVGSRNAFVTVPILIMLCWLGALPSLQIPFAALRWLTGKGEDKRKAARLFWRSTLLFGLTTASYFRLLRGLDVSAKYALSWPLALWAFSGILADSMTRSIFGRGLDWKGRDYKNAAQTQQRIR